MRPSLSVFSRGRRMLLTRKTLWSCCSAALLGACVSSSAIAQSAAAPEKLTDLLTICNDALQFNPEYESARASRSEEHTSELQSLMRISYAVFCLKKKKKQTQSTHAHLTHQKL